MTESELLSTEIGRLVDSDMQAHAVIFLTAVCCYKILIALQGVRACQLIYVDSPYALSLAVNCEHEIDTMGEDGRPELPKLVGEVVEVFTKDVD